MTGTAAFALPTAGLSQLMQLGRWSEICAAYERGMTRAEKEDPTNCLAYAIALMREGRVNSGLNQLTAELVAMPSARLALRRYAVAWLVRENRFEAAIAILGQLLAANPQSTDDMRLRASLLGRSRRYEEAIADAACLITMDPSDLGGHHAYLQLLLQDGQADSAGSHARSLGFKAADDPRLASMALLALFRAGLMPEAASLASDAADYWPDDADVIQAVVRIQHESGNTKRAIEVGEHCLETGSDGARLRYYLGQCYLSVPGTVALDRAVKHLSTAVRLDPRDANISARLGEALMRKGCHADAVPHLSGAASQQPRSPHVRALLARALKNNGQLDEAAREFRQLLELQPESHRWHRYAAGALSQAGHRAEAADLFEAFVARRAKDLPDDFEAGLLQLWEKIGSVSLPTARLDWAWHLRDTEICGREEWEQRARWGYLADHYMLDWLECRDDLAHEAMSRLADLSEAERKFAEIDAGRGLILASAHVGPMYAGPLGLELLDIKSQWLASTPSVARTAYARSLISTSDQSGSDVARKVLGSLQQGNAVVIAVDGAINMAAPRVTFEGQEVTYSTFASRMAHRLKIPSMFVAPRWENGHIGFVVERLPDPEPGEDADHHAIRWQQSFLDELRTYLGGAPENLRLSGGIWRHVRPPRLGDGY